MNAAPIPWIGRQVAGALILLIRAYQVAISPWLGDACRFEPSCSRYMVACLRQHGPIRGLARGLGRLLRCHPWDPGGFDPP